MLGFFVCFLIICFCLLFYLYIGFVFHSYSTKFVLCAALSNHLDKTKTLQPKPYGRKIFLNVN